jgi:trigger factor
VVYGWDFPRCATCKSISDYHRFQFIIVEYTLFEDLAVGGNVKVSVEKLPTSEAVLNVDLSWDEMEKASDKAYKKLVKKVDVQGFRRGKAPRSILERKVGKESLYQEGLDDLISETYRDVVKEHNLIPISQPKLDAPLFTIGQPYHFSVTVPIITPVELADYRSMHFEREEAIVTSEEVDNELQALRNRQSEWQVVDRPVEYNDRIKADLKLTSGEQKVSDLKDNIFEITNERHGLFKGMDEHLIGMKAGETKEFSTTISTDYTNEKLANQQADYVVTIHSVEEKALPELDDAFAAKVSNEECETVEALSKVLSDNILEGKKRRINTELRDKIINTLSEQSQFVLHPLLIEEEIEDMLHRAGHMFQQQHFSPEQYLKMIGKSREEYTEEVRPDAEKSVKRRLILDEIAQREQISVQADEIQAIFQAYAQLGQQLPETEEQIRSLMVSYRWEKAFKRLLELTTDPDPDAESEAEAEAASITSAEAAASAGETASEGQAESEVQTSEESATATPLPEESRTETVE